jgi:methionine synthase II (cobalamin-independent)
MPGGQFTSSSDPSFRAEHVGSLLRPATLLDARRRHQRHEIDDATLLEAEASAIRAAVELQERVGLRLATDGEFRRASYHSYFYGRLGDISFEVGETGADGRAAQPVSLIRSRLHWTQPIHVHDFAVVKAQTRLCPKITIPGPCALHFRGGDEAVLTRAYKDIDAFWDDVVTAFRSELKSLAIAGCRYVQIDETMMPRSTPSRDGQTSRRSRPAGCVTTKYRTSMTSSRTRSSSSISPSRSPPNKSPCCSSRPVFGGAEGRISEVTRSNLSDSAPVNETLVGKSLVCARNAEP